MNQKKKFIIGMVFISQAALAQSVRPSLMVTRSNVESATPVQQTNEMFLAGKKEMARRYAENLVNKSRLDIDEALKARLISALMENKDIETAISQIMNDSDPKHNRINQLRVELMVNLADIKITTDRAGSPDGLRLAELVFTVNPRGVTQEALTNLEFFLSELKTAVLAGADFGDALEHAQKSTALETNHEVNLDMIHEAMIRPQEGVIALFKGSQDRGLFTINGPEGVPLEVSMTKAQGEKLESDAWDMAMDLMQMAKDPAAVQDALANRALRGLDQKSTATRVFLESNPILDRKSTLTTETSKNSEKTAKSIDDLLKSLRHYDRLVVNRSSFSNAKDRAKDFLSKVPLVGMAMTSYEEAVTTERTKILEIEQALVRSAAQLAENNKTMMDVKLRAIKLRSDLEIEIAKVKIVSDYILHLAKEAEANGDKDLATTLRSEISQSLESRKNSAMTFYAALGAADKAFTQLITQANQLIQQGAGLVETAIPIISINQTAQIAGETLKQTAAQQKAVRVFVTSQLESLQKQLEKNAKTINEMAKLPLIDPKVLENFEASMRQIAVERTAAMEEAAVSLRGVNDVLTNMMNNERKNAGREALGLVTHAMVHGDAHGFAGSGKACAISVKGK